MRILLVCNKAPFPKHDGGSVAIYNLAASLSRLGHEVKMLSMLTEKHSLSEADLLFTGSGITLFTVHVSTRITWFALLKNFFFSRKPYIAERFISVPFQEELIRVLQSHTTDVVQLEGAYTLPYKDTIRRHSDALIAYRSHNVEHIIWRSLAKRKSNPFKKMYLLDLSRRLERFEKEYLEAYDILLPMSRIDEEIYRRMGNNRPVKICPAGYNTKDMPLQQKEDHDKCLFFLGSLDWIPNQEGLLWFVIKVLPALYKNLPGVVFYVAGRNAPSFLVRKLKDPHIVFCGEVSDAREFVHNKGIMVAPLFSGSGMRVKILEAMALGKPVVATTKAAEGIDVTPEADILLADQADGFMMQTIRLVQDPALYERISKNAMRLIREKYDSMKISRDLITFYQKHLPWS